MIVIMFSYLLVFITRFILWWGVFIVFTIIALIKIKFYLSPSYSIVIYYFVQEIRGVFFMFGFSVVFQLMLVVLKGGFAPLHNWLNSIIKGLKGLIFIWLITWQKLPYFLVLFQLILWSFVIIFIIGRIFSLLQSFFVKSFKGVLFILFTSRRNNLLVFSFFSPHHIIFVLPFYVYLLYTIVGVVNIRGIMFMGLESIFILISIPGSIPFNIKMLIIIFLSQTGRVFFIVFIIMLLLNILVRINVMFNFNYKFRVLNKHYVFIFFGLNFILYLCSGSEIITSQWYRGNAFGPLLGPVSAILHTCLSSRWSFRV